MCIRDRRYITKEELETVKNNVCELENKQTALSNSYAVVSKELVRMKENLSEVEKLNAELKKSSHRHDMLNELSKLVQGNKFVEYMAEDQLRYIAADASERLKKISGGRYAIEILDGEFIIRDDFCGGRKRYPDVYKRQGIPIVIFFFTGSAPLFFCIYIIHLIISVIKIIITYIRVKCDKLRQNKLDNFPVLFLKKIFKKIKNPIDI